MNAKEKTDIALSELYAVKKEQENEDVVNRNAVCHRNENNNSQHNDQPCKLHLNKQDICDHSPLTMKTDSWLGYVGTLFYILAIIILIWNINPSINHVEAVSSESEPSKLLQPQSEAKSVLSKREEYTYHTKRIEDFKEGDAVLAYDVRTGELVQSQVSGTSHLQCDHIRRLTVRDDLDEEQTFSVTDVHPYWVISSNPDVSRASPESVTVQDYISGREVVISHENLYITESGCYINASVLKLGDIFLTPTGEQVTVCSNIRESHPEGIDVYNITVADNSNYFVIANAEAFQNGAQPVLVHNKAMPTIVQSGGHTISDSAARKIIENNGLNPKTTARDLGRKLEKAKRKNKIPNDHHGKIGIDGSYYDDKGNFLFNFLR